MENLNRTYSKDEAFKVLDLVNESIKHTDNKSAILVGLITLLIGLTTKVFEAVNIISNWNNKVLCGFLLFLFILYCGAVALSIIFSSLVFVSRYKAVKYIKQNNLKGNSMLFFGDINKMGYKKFKEKSSSLSEEEFIDEINEQIIINSAISKKKAFYFNIALLFSLILLALTITLLILISV